MKLNTELKIDTETKLKLVAKRSKENPEEVFNNLMHLFNVNSLRDCFNELDGKKALGTDGISKDKYKEKIDNNLENLISKMKQMEYIPNPVRQVMIPKGNGGTRPLGISNFEDKIIQKMTQKILENIYEPLFLNCSHGFRPNRNCHTAIKSLSTHLFYTETEAIIDVDLSNFFGSIDHKILLDILKAKISDQKFIRYIIRMFKSGVLTDGELIISDEGVPQGSVCSPVLANIFAHHVIDQWFETIKPHYKAEMFRYADDIVIVSSHKEQATEIMELLKQRLTQHGIKLNTEKTKLVSFSKKEARKGISQQSFDFLGFTFYLGKSRRGLTIPKLKTSGKRMRTKLKKVNEWAQQTRNKLKLPQLWKLCCSKLNGHIRYYGVSHNTRTGIFKTKVRRIMFKWINRRSQRKSMTWEEFLQFEKLNPLPPVLVYVKLF